MDFMQAQNNPKTLKVNAFYTQPTCGPRLRDAKATSEINPHFFIPDIKAIFTIPYFALQKKKKKEDGC